MAKLELRGITKSFHDGSHSLPVIEPVDLEVAEHELVSLIGPSGCGKTTLFNIAAGLLEPDTGTVLIDGDTARREQHGVGYMLQKDLLLPWRSVLSNVGLGLELRGVRPRAARARARPLMERFGLAGFVDRYPSQRSGGMRQRAALLRTLLPDPAVLLLDEPFSALDAQTRSLMQEWLLEVKEQTGATVLLVTHDVEESIMLADRVYVMTARPGRIKACLDVPFARPRDLELVAEPEFVALKQQLVRLLRDESRLALDQDDRPTWR
jgi:ABC-type nitrate/sulfonate/bicarbonate transport system ATPase subunit